MDPLITTPWKDRILALRMTLKCSPFVFGRIMGACGQTVVSLERGKTLPNAYQISRIRLMEKAYEKPLEKYHKLRKKYSRKHTWGVMEKFYPKWEGNLYVWRMKEAYQSRPLLPEDPKYIELLGGIEVFGERSHGHENG